MEIVQKNLSELPSGIRAIYQKANDVIVKGSVDYGIELLKEIVKKDPGAMDARKALRKAEKEKFAKMNPLKKFFANLKLNKFILKGRAVLSKNPMQALACAEDALALNIQSISALTLMSDAAKAMKANFIALEAMDSVVELQPGNEAHLTAYAALCEETGEAKKLLRIRQMIASKHPDNLQAQADLRAAAALASMDQGKWNEKGNFADKRKAAGANSEADLKREDRIIRSEDDIKQMIELYEKQIAEGDTSVDNRRKLADFYQRSGRFQDAIDTYNWIVQKLGTLDPSIDKAIENSTICLYRSQIEQFKQDAGSEEAVQELEKKIVDYRLARAEDRVHNYPNDTLIRYEYACLLWEINDLDNALEQFQLAQKNPQKRLSAMVYLGQCFAAKKQFDMAIEQYERAIKEMPVMDDEKMNALYNMGTAYEAVNDREKSMDCFKQIYSADIAYRDVKAKMDAFYASKNA